MSEKETRPARGAQSIERDAVNDGANLTASPGESQTWEFHRENPRPAERWDGRQDPDRCPCCGQWHYDESDLCLSCLDFFRKEQG